MTDMVSIPVAPLTEQHTIDVQLQRIGEVGTDSGHVVILDPGMATLLEGLKQWFTAAGQWRQVEFPSGVSVSAGGDGTFPVYAVQDQQTGELLGVMVWFTDV